MDSDIWLFLQINAQNQQNSNQVHKMNNAVTVKQAKPPTTLVSSFVQKKDTRLRVWVKCGPPSAGLPISMH